MSKMLQRRGSNLQSEAVPTIDIESIWRSRQNPRMRPKPNRCKLRGLTTGIFQLTFIVEKLKAA